MASTRVGAGLCQLYDALTEQERDRYRALGAVAEVPDQVFDASGEVIATEAGARMISVRADQLRDLRELIAVSGGARCAETVHAVLRGRLLTGVVSRDDRARAPPERGHARQGMTERRVCGGGGIRLREVGVRHVSGFRRLEGS